MINLVCHDHFQYWKKHELRHQGCWKKYGATRHANTWSNDNLSHIVNLNKAVTVLANKERKPYFGLKSLLLLTIITCNLVCNGQLQWKGWAFRGTSCACYHSYKKKTLLHWPDSCWFSFLEVMILSCVSHHYCG